MAYTVPGQFDFSDTGARQNAQQYVTEGITDASLGSGRIPLLSEINGLWFIGPTSNPANCVINPPKGFSAAAGFFYEFVCIESSSSTTASISFINSSGVQFQINFTPGGYISVTSNGNTLASAGPALWFYNIVFHIKVFFNISASAGQVRIRLNGAVTDVINTGTAANTAAFPANLPVTYFQNSLPDIGAGIILGASMHWHDNTGVAPFNDFLPGMPVAAPFMPTADVGTPQFIPTGLANNWQVDANIPASGTVYNSGSTVNLTDVASFGTFPAGVSQVFGAKHIDYSLTTAGSRGLTKSLISGATVNTGMQNFLAAGPVSFADLTAYSVASPATLLASMSASAATSEISGWHAQIEITA